MCVSSWGRSVIVFLQSAHADIGWPTSADMTLSHSTKCAQILSFVLLTSKVILLRAVYYGLRFVTHRWEPHTTCNIAVIYRAVCACLFRLVLFVTATSEMPEGSLQQPEDDFILHNPV